MFYVLWFLVFYFPQCCPHSHHSSCYTSSCCGHISVESLHKQLRKPGFLEIKSRIQSSTMSLQYLLDQGPCYRDIMHPGPWTLSSYLESWRDRERMARDKVEQRQEQEEDVRWN